MREWQERYLRNVREVVDIRPLFGAEQKPFGEWYEEHRAKEARLRALREENTRLLSENLFPLLDALPALDGEETAALEAFGDALMDWNTNLDCGIYLIIHDALLRLYRFRKDRKNIIKELYMLGMGMYYQGRSIQGIECPESDAFHFQNEMLFTEAGSYLKFFPEIDDDQTRGFIIRALANIAIATKDLKVRVSTSKKVLQIVQDDYYKSLAPSLPWDVFLKKTHQQMSSNRAVLSKGGLGSEELAAVLESCEVVFAPESITDTPNVRWLWPYYEMEYSCGFVDLNTTLARMQRLITSVPYDQFDISGLYANVQLPIYYGRLMKDNPNVSDRQEHIRFLASAYNKMMQVLLSYPLEDFTDFFFYNICLVFTDYYETPGAPTYLEITGDLMKKLAGGLYNKSQLTGRIMQIISTAVFENDPGLFDDIPEISAVTDMEKKKQAVTDLAMQCGLYHDFGLIKMNFDRLLSIRDLFEKEQALYELHTVSGHDDLAARPSTEHLADTALGHHRWYNGLGGYPETYVRNDSPYRQMTDLAAIASVIADAGANGFGKTLEYILSQEGKRFSPVLTAYLDAEDVQEKIKEIL